jgi:hypothetical protein
MKLIQIISSIFFSIFGQIKLISKLNAFLMSKVLRTEDNIPKMIVNIHKIFLGKLTSVENVIPKYVKYANEKR